MKRLPILVALGALLAEPATAKHHKNPKPSPKPPAPMQAAPPVPPAPAPPPVSTTPPAPARPNDHVRSVMPRVVFPVNELPKNLQDAGVGIVRVEFLVTAKSEIKYIKILDSTNPRLNDAVLDIVRHARATPAMEDGKPRDAKAMHTFSFISQ